MHGTLFFKVFLKNCKQVGWPLQTSHESARRVCETIDFKKARRIVEVGSGSGNITKELLKHLHPEAELIAFEIDRDLCGCLEAIQDRRLVVYNESGFNMAQLLQEKVDYVISEIPIATLSPASFRT